MSFVRRALSVLACSVVAIPIAPVPTQSESSSVRDLLAPRSATKIPATPVQVPGTLDYPHRIAMEATSGEGIVFEYETIADPSDGLFYRVGRFVIGPDDRQYYLDSGDDEIKVLSSDNEFLFSFGGRGQAPGQWQDTQVFSVAPNGSVYVWDSDLNLFHVFAAEGSYLHRVNYPGRKLTIENLVWIGDDEFFASAVSMDLGYYRYAVHRLRIVDVAPNERVLERIESFVEVPDYEPGLYQILARGLLRRDIDGSLLFSASTRHLVESYDLDTTLRWGLSDPTVIPNAVDSLSVGPSGRVRMERIAQAAGLLATADWIVHEVFVEAEGVPPRPPGPGRIEPGDVDPSGVIVRKVIELIDREDPDGSRLIIRTTEDLLLQAVDSEGRIYGVVNYFENPTPVRGRLLVGGQQ